VKPKVAVATDSIASLSRELVEQYKIRIVLISFCVGDKVYRDWEDVTPSQAYELFLKDPELFKTSAPSPGEFVKAYRELSKEARNILCITLSSKLSTTYNTACVAREQAKPDLPQTSIKVLDSQTATAAQGFIALAAARAAAEGKGLAEVTKIAEEIRDKVTFVVLLDTIRYVYRTGRIPKVAAQVGSMFNIRPILTISSGLVRFTGAVRNKEHGINRLLRVMRNKVGLSPAHIAVMHVYALDEAKRLKERVVLEFNCAELWLTEFSPLMGYACGVEAVGFSFYKDD